MKVLVTGGTGFIGLHLVKVLVKKGYKVSCLVRKKSNIKNLRNVKLVYGSLEDINSLKNATKNVDVVFHCAALLGSPKIKYKEMKKVNTDGTENILKAAVVNKVKKFIHISTVGVMGFCKPEANEKTKCAPVSDYDKTKYMAEKLVKEFGIKHSLSFVIIRPVMVYGPGETKAKAKLSRLIQKGMFRIIGNGKNLVSLVYIDDLVKGIILASENKKAIGQTYIISDGKKHSMNEFVSVIAKAVDVKIPGHIPLWLAKTVAYIFDIISKLTKIYFPLYRDRVNNLTISRSFNINKAKKELGYSPKVKLEEGIKRTVEWYKEEGIFD